MLLASFYINYKKVFDLVLTGDNTKDTKKIVIQRKYKKCSIFVKNADISKKVRRQYNIFLDFSKPHKLLSTCANFECLAFSHQKKSRMGEGNDFSFKSKYKVKTRR